MSKIKQYTGGNAEFLAACRDSGTAPTKRQWKKWTQKRGRAYRYAAMSIL